MEKKELVAELQGITTWLAENPKNHPDRIFKSHRCTEIQKKLAKIKNENRLNSGLKDKMFVEIVKRALDPAKIEEIEKEIENRIMDKKPSRISLLTDDEEFKILNYPRLERELESYKK